MSALAFLALLTLFTLAALTPQYLYRRRLVLELAEEEDYEERLRPFYEAIGKEYSWPEPLGDPRCSPPLTLPQS